jgi:protein AroM
MKKIGTITIGQSPRADIIPELQALLESDSLIIEKGALDGLTKEQIAQLSSGSIFDEVLVTRLADGTAVTISDKAVIPRIQQCIQELEQEEVSAVLLLSTGTFPTFTAQVPLLVPETLLNSFVRGVAYNSIFKLGVLTPSSAQIPQQYRRWHHKASDVIVQAASPYSKLEQVVEAGIALARQGVDAVILDSIGYTSEMKQRIRAAVACPVILSRSVLARFAAELA